MTIVVGRARTTAARSTVEQVPRIPRLQASGAIYHITANAARQMLLFADGDDYRVFVRLLEIVTTKVAWRCHSYCLMGTHYHLLVETPEPNIADAMQRLNWLYARTFNNRHGFRGHCFDERYASELVQSTAHFQNVIRYIARNPVEAGLCESPTAWKWSSYAATAGLVEAPGFLCIDAVLESYDDRVEVARRLMRGHVEPRSM